MTKVEGVVNSRPITFISDKFSEPKPLRPIDFLIPVNQEQTPVDIDLKGPVPDGPFDDNDPDYNPHKDKTRDQLLKQWKLWANKIDSFWREFQSNYLTSLRERKSRVHKGNSLIPRVNEVVIIEEEDIPRNSWRLGRITELILSSDGNVRAAIVRTSEGHYLKRDLTQLFPMEVDNDVSNCINSALEFIADLSPLSFNTNEFYSVDDRKKNTTDSAEIVSSTKGRSSKSVYYKSSKQFRASSDFLPDYHIPKIQNGISKKQKIGSHNEIVTPMDPRSHNYRSLSVKSHSNEFNNQVCCQLCTGQHAYSSCPKFVSALDRLTRAAEINLCIRCLGVGHDDRNCRFMIKCNNCRGLHRAAFCGGRKVLSLHETSNFQIDTSKSVQVNNVHLNDVNTCFSPFFICLEHHKKPCTPMSTHSVCENYNLVKIRNMNDSLIPSPLHMFLLIHFLRTYPNDDGVSHIINTFLKVESKDLISTFLELTESEHLRSESRKLPVFWHKSTIESYVDAWASSCCVAKRNLEDVWSPFSYYSVDEKGEMKDVIHANLIQQTVLHINQLKAKKGFSGPWIRTQTTIIGDIVAVNISEFFNRVFKLTGKTDELINEVHKYYFGPAVSLVLVALKGGDFVQLKAEIIEYLLNYSHFKIGNIVFSKNEPIIDGKNVFEIDLSDCSSPVEINDVELEKLTSKIHEETNIELSRSEKLPKKKVDLPLAHSSFQRVSLVPRMASLTILMLMALFTPVFTAPMVCPPGEPPKIFKIVPESCKSKFDKSATVKNISLTIFKPNSQTVLIPGHYCTIIHTAIAFYTSFWFDRFENVSDPQHLMVSGEECRKMYYEKKCHHGDLIGDPETISRTKNEIKVEYKWMHSGNSEATNCILAKTMLMIKPGDLETISSPLASMKDCRFIENTCLIDEGRFLWDSREIISSRNNCRFLEMGKWEGKFADNTFLTMNGEFALTFSKENELIDDCDTKIHISDQGYGVKSTELDRYRVRRSAASGPVDSTQLAAQLTAAELAAFQSLFEFAHEICLDRQILFFNVFSLDPTSVARELFKSEYVAGRWIGTDHLEVRNCIPVNITFAKINKDEFDGMCFVSIPVNVSWINGKQIAAFLDPKTSIVTKTSEKRTM